jgi:hypothetical protein
LPLHSEPADPRHYEQGDQIGRIVAHWAIVHFEQFLDTYRSSPVFWLLSSTIKNMH